MRLLLVLVLVLSGCFWRGYERVTEVHLQVLESMTTKLCALTEGPPPASEGMGEFVYPLKRARELQRDYASRSGRPSYGEFGAVVDAYERLVQEFDRARVSAAAWSAAAPAVCEQSRSLSRRIAAVREQLAREG